MKTPFSIRGLIIAELAMLLGYISLAVVQMPGFADDPGVGWHLQGGDFVIEEKTVPKLDPFLAAPFSRVWVSDQWGGDVILSLLYSINSYPAIYALLTSIFLIVFFYITLKTSAYISGSTVSATIATLCAFKMSQIHFILRPVVFGFLFFSILAMTLIRVDIEKQRVKKNWWLFVPFFALWANIHPTFILGLVLFAIYVATNLTKNNIILFCCVALATLINPYGIELHRSIFALGGNEYFMNLHMEWMSPNFKELEGKFFEVCIGIICIAGFFCKSRRVPLTFFALIALLVFAHGALQAIRVLPFFAIISAPYVALALTDIGDYLVDARIWLARRVGAIFSREDEQQYLGSLGAVILSLLVLISGLFYGKIPFFSGEFGPQRDKFPYAAVSYLLQNNIVAPVVADPNWGGFLIRYGEGKIKPVIDDRNTLLGEQWYKRHYRSLKPSGDWKQYAAELKTSYLLLPTQGEFTYVLKKLLNVSVLFEDDVATLFDVKNETIH